MPVIKIKAVFNGRSGSMGFEKKKEYTLQVRHSKDSDIVLKNTVPPYQSCPYGSMVALLQNWDTIRRI